MTQPIGGPELHKHTPGQPDVDRVPTEADRIMAGTLSTIWPMCHRHPEDAIHLAIFVNDTIGAQVETAERQRDELAAIFDPDKLEYIAEHLDLTDELWIKFAEQRLGDAPGKAAFIGKEMQADLRRWANEVRAALDTPPAKEAT